MKVYHLTIGSRYFKKFKYLFESKAKAEDFVKKLRLDPPFIDEDAKQEFLSLSKKPQEDAMVYMYTLTTIDTRKCPQWKKLFKGEMIV